MKEHKLIPEDQRLSVHMKSLRTDIYVIIIVIWWNRRQKTNPVNKLVVSSPACNKHESGFFFQNFEKEATPYN